jgi:hypothetical protein
LPGGFGVERNKMKPYRPHDEARISDNERINDCPSGKPAAMVGDCFLIRHQTFESAMRVNARLRAWAARADAQQAIPDGEAEQDDEKADQ